MIVNSNYLDLIIFSTNLSSYYLFFNSIYSSVRVFFYYSVGTYYLYFNYYSVNMLNYYIYLSLYGYVALMYWDINEYGTVMYNLLISWIHYSFIIYFVRRSFGNYRINTPAKNNTEAIAVFTKLHVVRKLFIVIA